MGNKINKCPICNAKLNEKEIESYLCVKCRGQAYKMRSKNKEKTCTKCGELKASKNFRIYLDEGNYKFANECKSCEKVNKKCVKCGKEFETTLKAKHGSCNKCISSVNKIRKETDKKGGKVCKICRRKKSGIEFSTRYEDGLYILDESCVECKRKDNKKESAKKIMERRIANYDKIEGKIMCKVCKKEKDKSDFSIYNMSKCKECDRLGLTEKDADLIKCIEEDESQMRTNLVKAPFENIVDGSIKSIIRSIDDLKYDLDKYSNEINSDLNFKKEFNKKLIDLAKEISELKFDL